MVKSVEVQNFKSISNLKLELGRINVFIGENGSGKSNILEAVAFGAAASANKLDKEFLVSKGMRVPEPKLVRSAFNKDMLAENVNIAFQITDSATVNSPMLMRYDLSNNNEEFSKWEDLKQSLVSDVSIMFEKYLFGELSQDENSAFSDVLRQTLNADQLSKIEAMKASVVVKKDDFKVSVEGTLMDRNEYFSSGTW